MAADSPNFLKYWLVLRRRWLPSGLAFASVLTAVIFNVLAKPDIYRARGELSFDIEGATPGLTGLPTANQVPWARRWNSKVKLEKAKRVLFSTPLLEQVAHQQPASRLGTLRRGLKVSPIAEINVLTLTFDSVDPQLSAQILNQLMRVYINYDLQKSRATLTSSRKFIATQLPQVRQRLVVAESALRNFKEINQTSGLEAAQARNAAGQAQAQGQLDEVNKQLSGLNVQIADLQGQLGLQSQDAVALSSPAVQEALQRLAGVKNELTVALTQFQPEHPQVVALLEQQQELQQSLRSQITPAARLSLQTTPPKPALLDQLIELGTTRKGLLQQRAVLAKQRLLYKQQIDAAVSQLPLLEQQQRELERDITAAEGTYEILLRRLEEIKVTEKQTIPAVQVVEPAQVPRVPVGPHRVQEIIRGAIAGLLLAAAVAYLLELLDRTLKATDDIQEYYPIIPLATMPRFKAARADLSQLPALTQPHSPIGEAYRMLQVQLKFLQSDIPVRVLAITSAQPQEGKSTTCANLAVVLAQMGHRVLLVDVDLRRPSQHQIWSVSNAYGLTHLLTEPEPVIDLPTQPVMDNLELLPAGVIPPNPLALLDSGRMAAFVETQRHQYDYILLDTPPITAAADSLVLGKHADGILLVARPKVLEKSSAKMAWKTLKQADLNILGTVINGVIPEHEGENYYYYSQGYYGVPEAESGDAPDQEQALNLNAELSSQPPLEQR